ncbi:MAG: hypothetical protein ACYS0E_17930 [Planctomycetota bacterium]|jgi:hypothetical protein
MWVLATAFRSLVLVGLGTQPGGSARIETATGQNANSDRNYERDGSPVATGHHGAQVVAGRLEFDAKPGARARKSEVEQIDRSVDRTR